MVKYPRYLEHALEPRISRAFVDSQPSILIPVINIFIYIFINKLKFYITIYSISKYEFPPPGIIPLVG